MKKIIQFFALLLLIALPTQAAAQGWTAINKAIVLDRLMPAGTAVKIKIVRISDQFGARLDILLFQESVFSSGTPGTYGTPVRAWSSERLRPGDVVSYTTTASGFIGIFAGWDYSGLNVSQLDRGALLTMDYNGHQWQVVVIFPDYE
jgi:hypothetical protein